jgi:hypothetical protein
MTKSNLTTPERKRTSVAIEGLDHSTPDDIVKDGACAVLHNLRFKDGAWRPVSDFSSVQFTIPFAVPTGDKIVYKHPATADDKYILQRFINNKYFYYEISTTTASITDATLIASFDEEQKVSHFGNVLTFRGASTTSFLLSKNRYTTFVIQPYSLTSISSYSSKHAQATQVRLGDRQAGFGYPWEEYNPGNIQGANSPWEYRGAWFPIHNITQDYPTISAEDDHWVGELLLFTTWRMADGTNLSPSPLHLLKSYEGKYPIPNGYARKIGIAPSPREQFLARQSGKDISSLDKYLAITIEATNIADTEVYAPQTEQFTRAWLPNLRIDIPVDAELSAVTHIAIWATRIHPIFAFNRTYSVEQGRDNNFGGTKEIVSTSESFISYYDKTNLAEQPFYLVREIPVEDIITEEGKRYINIQLSSSVLENITTNLVYAPNNNVHDVDFDCVLDYNNQLHTANITTRLCDGYNLGDNEPEDTTKHLQRDYISIEVNNAVYNVLSTSMRSNTGAVGSSPYSHVLSYPDARAKSIKADGIGKFTFTPAVANNFAWYHAPHSEEEKYPLIERTLHSFVHPDDDVDNREVKQPNRIQVSAPNNCFSFPFENSYAVGSSNNRIIALQSAAIKIGDEKVGALPLYVFTTEGIYALRAGENTLYATVNPINYDKIINPNTLAINGAIVYITEKGVHLLTDEGSAIISGPIHGSDGRPPLDFLRTCQIMWPKEHNEVIFHNPCDGIGTAYVFNLDAEYWSTRSLTGTKINTDEMVSRDTIYDLSNEDAAKPLSGAISTRPIKLGNVEFKRVDTIIPRMSTGTSPVAFSTTALGSVDGSTYHRLRSISGTLEAKKVNPIVIRRTPFSAKYLSLIFSFEAANGEGNFDPSITHIDFEWYTKFQRRMR